MGFGFSFIEVLVENFPGNSYKQQIIKETSTEANNKPRAERLKKVANGKTVRKTFSQSVRDVFVVEGRGFIDHLIKEVIIPAGKEMVDTAIMEITEGVKKTIRQKMFGDSYTARATPPSGTGRPVNYNGYSRTAATSTPRREETRSNRRRSNRVETVTVETREDALEVIRNLDGKIQTTGHATVGDLYDSTGIDTEYTDDFWGWYSVEAFRIERLGPNKHLIRTPNPEPVGE